MFLDIVAVVTSILIVASYPLLGFAALIVIGYAAKAIMWVKNHFQDFHNDGLSRLREARDSDTPSELSSL